MTKTVLVCGGRHYSDYENVKRVLDGIEITRVIHGNAKGADILGDRYAKDNGIERIIYPANWDGFGKSGGYIRNSLMLKHGGPDLVVAFPGGRGTAMMVDIAEKAGVEVMHGWIFRHIRHRRC